MHLAQSFSGSKKGATACVLMLAAMLAFFTLAPQNALAAAYTWTGGTVPTVANGDSVTIAPTASGAGPSGTLNVPAAATITIDGTVTGSTNGITLNVPADATVIWTATLHGARPGSKLVTLTGGGTLNVYGGLIVNVGSTSASGALAVTGDGCTVNVAQGGIVTSDSSGTAILISANNVTVNVNGSGTVQSLKSDPTTTSTGSALQIGGSATLTGTQVNVNGGSVIADYGYAINDGAGANVIAGQNSIITISGATALVQSQTACAIHSTGSDTQVTVSGGMVTNNASSNANPTINMLGDGETQGSYNVVISGGVVQNTNTATTAYSIQTLGNLQVTGGTITTANGRGINLAGSSSNATVSGGLIQATGSGVALCTATTTIPPNTSITMSGGTISANSSYAIEITGANSTLSMTGGTVQSVTSDA
ncbi:MAG: hypothetical protein FWE46_04365, partial [Coriobacteriia bacterium]|nr:hypothetical protein [Coriobacteriia bacterium]